MSLLMEGDKPSSQPPKAQHTVPAVSPGTDTAARVEALIAALKASGTDITASYADWLKVGFAIAGEFGEAGRPYFHAISSLYPGYDQAESDKKYDECLKSNECKTDIATIFYLAKNQGVTIERPANAAGTSQRLPREKVKVTKMSLCPFRTMTPKEFPTSRCSRSTSTRSFPACSKKSQT